MSLGGAQGILGSPVGPRVTVLDGQVQNYDRGDIWWSPATGAWPTWGDMHTRYLALGGATGVLGFPTSLWSGVAGGTQQSFVAGALWWSPGTGAWPTFGAMHTRYLAMGGPAGVLGFPTSLWSGVAGGTQQSYVAGALWRNPGTGAWPTFGAMHTRYLAMGGPAGVLGFPTSLWSGVAGGTQQSYVAGALWWSPGTGAWPTFGAMHTRYLAIGGAASPLGFPRSMWTDVAGGTTQPYTGGTMWWSPGSGAWETTGAIDSQFAAAGGAAGWYGFPTAAAHEYYGGGRQDFRGGSLLAGAQAVLDATYAPVSPADVWATWRSGCPVGPSSLTLIRLNFWGFDATLHRGEIIVRSDLAGRVAAIFGSALAERYPIRSMWRVDYYGGSDPASMAADNTSGFNCRQVTGGSGLSPHSYGIAIDINTLENPYYAGGRWWPTTEYVDRSNVRVGMLFSSSGVTRAFASYGYSWGGSYLDYQHFQYVG